MFPLGCFVFTLRAEAHAFALFSLRPHASCVLTVLCMAGQQNESRVVMVQREGEMPQ